MLPPITICMTVYFPKSADGIKRVQVAHDTLASWQKYLKYDGELHLHVADDGSELGTFNPWSLWYQNEITFSRQERRGVGASLNAGFAKAFEISPLVLYAIDDWSLTAEFDTTSWAKVLMEWESIGVVRLGIPHPNLTGRVQHLGELGWGLVLDRYSYAFGHRPALYHKRLIDHYDWFKENCSPLECERDYSDRINADPSGPDVMLALPHPWEHIDSISMSGFAPGEI